MIPNQCMGLALNDCQNDVIPIPKKYDLQCQTHVTYQKQY
ncbi:hypothetical protein M917_2774 [Psychrobacter aquaticus CMS 56]|uniref:Uncharacterized protein n=1 Tax=Psychrobacter aquaticus CMS 56 TaxID=1354303 RepID=U4T3J7_9GAMM|nr:hypothetical protein M917_2774 [Psychrobacter aquaticus CMS 56]